MQKKFIRIEKIMELTGLAKSTVWLWVKQNKLPQPIKLSPRVTVWQESDVLEWMNTQVEGGNSYA